MQSWQEDLFGIVDVASCETLVFKKIESAAHALGFDYCAYGLRIPQPFSNPRTCMLNNYSEQWKSRYAAQGYLQIDPTVAHGRRSQVPVVWSDEVFAPARELWADAQAAGLCIGWAQSSLDAAGGFGMLSLARSAEPLTSAELSRNQVTMRWLAHVAHMALSRILTEKQSVQAQPNLTAREIEVLKWTADGKTSAEISDLLVVSENTVNFHVKNAVAKLQTANKTAATVRAAMLGLLG